MKLTEEVERDNPLSEPPAFDAGSSTRTSRRLIKVDYSIFDTLADDEDEEVEVEILDEGDKPSEDKSPQPGPEVTSSEETVNPWQRTGSLRLSQAEIHHYCDTALQCRLPNKSTRVTSCCIL